MTRLIVDALFEAPAEIVVEGQEHHYLTRVRRHRAGDGIAVRNKKGHCFTATVLSVEKERAVLSIDRQIQTGSPVYPAHLIVAVPKRNLLDDVVRKVSEIGIERILPVWTARSVARPSPDKIDRWRKIAREALRQCGRASPLYVEEIQSIEDAFSSTQEGGTRFLLHPDHPSSISDEAISTSRPSPPFTVAIGPEGGFTDEEMARAVSSGFCPTRLEMPILRVETAAIAASVLMVTALRGDNPFAGSSRKLPIDTDCKKHDNKEGFA